MVDEVLDGDANASLEVVVLDLQAGDNTQRFSSKVILQQLAQVHHELLYGYNRLATLLVLRIDEGLLIVHGNHLRHLQRAVDVEQRVPNRPQRPLLIEVVALVERDLVTRQRVDIVEELHDLGSAFKGTRF
jgi:hypothetical protein